MSHRRWSLQSCRRSTLWHLWWSCEWPNASKENPAIGLLLANHWRRLRQICSSLREVSTSRRQDPHTRIFSPSIVLTMAFLYVSIWRGWTLIWNRIRSSKVKILHPDCNRILYKVGWSWSLRRNQSFHSGQVHQDQYHCKIRCPKSNCHKQWTPIRFSRTPRYVRQVWHPTPSFLAILSTRKRTSWSYQ